MKNNNRLYWWSERFIQKKQQENYGDLVGAYLFEKISGHAPTFYRKKDQAWWKPHRAYHATIGSIINHLDGKAIVWGSGIISREDHIPNATFLAVRGPLSRKRIQEHHIDCPAVYGDPALLLPRYYTPQITPDYELGVIPHINDLALVKEMLKDSKAIKIIDLNTNDVEATTREIRSCKYILSSSLHGLIVPHSYGIPAVQVRFSDRIYGDGVKYLDYYQSVALQSYDPLMISNASEITVDAVKSHEQSLPDAAVIANLCDGLMSVCPFKSEFYES